MAVSNAKQSARTRNQRPQQAGSKHSKLQGRKLFFEGLEVRSLMAVVPMADTFTVNEGSGNLVGNVIAGDGIGGADDVSGQNGALSVSLFGAPLGGLTLNNDGSFTFTNTGDGTNVFTFQYTVEDTDGISAPATVTFNVNNVAPTAVAISGPLSLTANIAGTYSFTGPTDVTADTTGPNPLRYSFATSPGGLAPDFASASLTNSASIAFATPGNQVVFGRVYDKDGGISGLFQLNVNVVASPSISPSLSGGDLVITDTDVAGKNNSLSISNNGAGSIVITDAVEGFTGTGGIAGAALSNGNRTLTVPIASITGTQIIINGGGGIDTLTANVANALGKILTFNGDAPTTSPGDKLVVTGGTFATGTLNHTNASDGSVVLGTNTINYTGLEPVDVTGSTITDLVINLPDNAVTGDDTELSIVAGNLVVTSLNGTHELDAIALAVFTTVTVNARAGDDTIRLDSTMSTLDKALTLNGGAGADSFVFESSLTAPGTVTVNGGAGTDTLDYSGYQIAAVDTSVAVSLSATAANGFSGEVKAGGSTITSFTEIDAVTGNSVAAGDTLTGLNAASDWTIDESTSSKYVSTGTLNFSKFERLTGGSNADAFTVTNTGAVPFILAGGAGNNSLDLSAVAGATVSLTNVDAAGAGGKETTKNITFSNIKTLTGDGTGTLTGANTAATWIIDDGASNTYATDLTFAGFKTLTGGDAVDTFNVLNNSGAITYTLKGGAGLDAFNFGQSNSLANVSKGIAVDGETDGATLTLNDQGVATNLNYTAGANTIGCDAGGTVTYTAVTDLTLNASNGSNTIKITATPTATGTKTFNGGSGDDVLDVTGLAATVVINNPNATKGFDGTVTGVASFTGIESFKGNNTSLFQGDDEVSTWTINDTTGSTYVSQSRTANITGFNVLQGGSKVDTYNVQDNSGALAYTLKGGAGADAFNFGNANSLAAISKNITVDGETDSATLTLNDQGVASNLNYTAGANTIGRDTGGTVTYTSITDMTLNASNGSNTVKVTAVPTATGVKTLNGGTGDDVLDLSTLALTDVTLTAANATKGFNGTVAGVANFTGVEEIKGNGTGDLTGLNEDATWTINDTTGHTYAALSKTLKFSGFDNLNGGSKVDTFKVQNNSVTVPLFTLTGNAGADKFLIGDTVNKLAGLKDLTVVGGADVGDELTLNDQAEAGANDYTITATTAQDDGGVKVTHTTVEKITLNASNGVNAVKVVDGAYNPSTTIKIVDTTGASTLAVDDTADASGNTWTITNAQVARTAPTPTLTIDYSTQATITSLSFAGGSAVDNVTVNSTKVATTVSGNAGNDVFNVGNGDLDNFLGSLTIDGGLHDLADTRTVFKGGATPGPADIVFTPTPTVVAKGDSLTVNDSQQAGTTKYQINNTTVSRDGASKVVTYSNLETLSLLAGKDESDIRINLPAAAPPLPFVVSVDGGNAAKDNRVQIKGTTANDEITIGNATGLETNRSPFEVTSVTRLWVEGDKGADTIHNRSSVPGLLDGGYQKSSNAIDAGNQNDVIASDAPSTTAFSPVLLGNDGLDFLYTTNSSTSGTTYLVGDYFVNNNVPLTAGSASKTSRLQVVAGPGQAGDRYITNHTPTNNLRNRVLARIDTAANSYSGRFANLTADTIGKTLGVIEWLRGRLPLTVSASGMAAELAKINYQIRLFVRDPGSAAAPAFPNATYNPGGVASGGSFNGGEAVEDDSPAAPLVQNPFDAGDVNGDGRISAFDALLIINELNRNGAHLLDTSPDGEFGVNGTTPIDFLDVNGDSSVSAFDALLIINRLNLNGTTGAVLPDSFQWFVDADNAEQAAADWANQISQQTPPASSVSDEALLALLGTHDDADNES